MYSGNQRVEEREKKKKREKGRERVRKGEPSNHKSKLYYSYQTRTGRMIEDDRVKAREREREREIG